jgi:hypothetical protein
MTRRPDWTVAFDDLMCLRYQACLECGQPARRLDVLLVSGRVVMASRCLRCYARDTEAVQLIARLARRN